VKIIVDYISIASPGVTKGIIVSDNTLEAFYQSCDDSHRQLFERIIIRWEEKGGLIDVKSTSVSLDYELEKRTISFCTLRHAHKNVGAMIMLSYRTIERAIGIPASQVLFRSLQAVNGLQFGAGQKVMTIKQPAEAPESARDQMVDLICQQVELLDSV